MAFEELTSRHAVMWGSAPFENIAELISEMHVALVERRYLVVTGVRKA